MAFLGGDEVPGMVEFRHNFSEDLLAYRGPIREYIRLNYCCSLS